jgi:hypothetical protein
LADGAGGTENGEFFQCFPKCPDSLNKTGSMNLQLLSTV